MRQLALLFVTLSVFSAGLARELAAQDMPPALVETEEIRELEIHETLTLVGRTQARRESRIVAEVSGRVKSVAVAEGRAVQRGQALVTVDCRRTAIDLDAKTAEAAQAKADAELASKDLARARDLVETSVFPERNLDSAVAAAQRTAERHKELEAERRRLKLDLENCTIRAPFGGTTVRKLVDVGEWVEAGTPVYELVDLSVIEVTADLPERRYGQVEIGSSARVTRAGTDGAAVVGKVVGIAPRASEATHTFPVILEVENADGFLGSGMLVRAELTMTGTFSSLTISKDAVIHRAGRTFVFTVDEGTAQEVEVDIRANSGSRVAISGEGLQTGIPVIVRGNERVGHGSPVQTEGRQRVQEGESR